LDVDFACISGQATAAAVPDSLIDVCFADHDYASFPARDSNNENVFCKNLQGRRLKIV